MPIDDEYPAVKCSTCGAAPGTPCMEVVEDGRIAVVPCHGSRRMVALWRAAVAATCEAAAHEDAVRADDAPSDDGVATFVFPSTKGPAS